MLCDYHVHCFLSADSDANPRKIIENAINMGLSELCFCDHYDCNHDYYDFCPGMKNFIFDLDKQKKLIEPLKDEYKDKIKILRGVEFGQCFENEKRYNFALENGDFDFVIGSVHNFPYKEDYYYIDYSKVEPQKLLDDYFETVLKFVSIGEYDVAGHIGYPVRYLYRNNIKVNLDKYYDKYEEILKVIIKRGKGIEINTSCIDDDYKEFIPKKEIISLYKKLGGTRITVGSDSHKAENVAKNNGLAINLLKECGFESISTFEKRKERPVKI